MDTKWKLVEKEEEIDVKTKGIIMEKVRVGEDK